MKIPQSAYAAGDMILGLRTAYHVRAVALRTSAHFASGKRADSTSPRCTRPRYAANALAGLALSVTVAKELLNRATTISRLPPLLPPNRLKTLRRLRVQVASQAALSRQLDKIKHSK